MRGVLTVTLVAVAIGCGPAHKPATHAKPAPLPPLPAAAYAHYLHGRIAMHEGRFARAVLRFRAAVAVAPREAPIRVALIDALHRAGRTDEALVEADRAQHSFAGDPEVWLVSGRVLRGAKRNRDALAAYQKAIELAPADEHGYLAAAGLLRAMGKDDRAEATYRALLDHVPGSVTAHYRLGERLLARGQTADAIVHLRAVLADRPDHIEARVALARGLRATGKKAEATAVLRTAFDRSGGDPDVGDALFHQLLDVGDRAGAIELLALLDRDDLDLDARLTFGYLYLQIGEHARALRLVDRLAASLPRNGDVRLLRAQVLHALGRTGEAIEPLLELADGEIAYAECRAYATELLLEQGDTERAEKAVEEALSTHANHVDLIIARARVLERKGDDQGARRAFQLALGARPANVDLLYAYGSLEDRLGHPEAAETIVGRILERDPDNPTALNFIGYSLADRNVDLPRAARLLQRAVQLSPGNGFVLDSFGWLQFRQGRVDEALATLERAARLVPREPEILWHLAELHLARGQRGKAQELLRQAQALRPAGKVRKRIEARLQALRPG